MRKLHEDAEVIGGNHVSIRCEPVRPLEMNFMGLVIGEIAEAYAGYVTDAKHYLDDVFFLTVPAVMRSNTPESLMYCHDDWTPPGGKWKVRIVLWKMERLSEANCELTYRLTVEKQEDSSG